MQRSSMKYPSCKQEMVNPQSLGAHRAQVDRILPSFGMVKRNALPQSGGFFSIICSNGNPDIKMENLVPSRKYILFKEIFLGVSGISHMRARVVTHGGFPWDYWYIYLDEWLIFM